MKTYFSILMWGKMAWLSSFNVKLRDIYRVFLVSISGELVALTPTLHKPNWIYQAWNYFIVTFSKIMPKSLATIITHFSRRGSKVSFMCLRMPAFLSGWDSNTLSNELNSADCEKKKKYIFRKAGWFFKMWEQFWNDFSKTNHTTALAGDWWLA
mgnify:CR=1 FL=1